LTILNRGVCVGNPAFAIQNDGNWIKYGQSPAGCVGGCIADQGPPVFANPASIFKRDAEEAHKAVRSFQFSEQIFGPQFG
jgi:hypothetical protein